MPGSKKLMDILVPCQINPPKLQHPIGPPYIFSLADDPESLLQDLPSVKTAVTQRFFRRLHKKPADFTAGWPNKDHGVR